jgi:hypothetical protein
MGRLFGAFETAGLEYLLISGQATVLYGAATFSEDIDLWIRPTVPNARKLLTALAETRARVHRLTPPLTARNMDAGRGFHFVIPGKRLDTYLDIMARPPRVGSFGAARRRARYLKTSWGLLPVLHPLDLVEIKKTRCLADYDIITNLALLYLAEKRTPEKADLSWAAENCFRPEERSMILSRLGRAQSFEECALKIATEILDLQARDRAYWAPIIDSLRVMRRQRQLLADGTPVTQLLRQF